MRDLIWTLIIGWVIFRLLEFFRSSSRKKEVPAQTINTDTSPSRDLHKAAAKRYEKEGEYVDFEEIR
jgi:hypothetical protein